MKKRQLLMMGMGAAMALGMSTGEDDPLVRFATRVYRIPKEKVYIHTDKSTYVVGERLWWRAYLVDPRGYDWPTLSKYVYVDLIDRRDSLITRVKAREQQDTACFHGYLDIPTTLPDGEYCLRGYSYYMQNDGEDGLFTKRLRVVNPRDKRVKSEVSINEERDGKRVVSVHLTNEYGVPYNKVSLLYQTTPERSDFERSAARTDEDGKVSLRLGPEVKDVTFSFRDGDPFPFSRRVYLPRVGLRADVQFFPEGGTLLTGNWQRVAFKAIGPDGFPVEVDEGEVYQDSTLIATFTSTHDGMGMFRIPVSSEHRYSVMTRLETGEVLRQELPEPSETGFGVIVATVEDSILSYRVIKGERSEFPEDLYLLVHASGHIMGLERVDRLFKGRMQLNDFPEGIAHVMLVDKTGRVYSERIVFVRQPGSARVRIAPDKSKYSARELVTLSLDLLAGGETGTFSMAVTDDSHVSVDTLEDHILSNLLLTSELKGYIHAPGYYFSGADGAREALDLVMMTHGWRRFDFSTIVQEESVKWPYPVERGQVVTGKVDNYWGNSAKSANLILLSTRGVTGTGSTDESGRFSIDIAYPDSTQFIIQALSERGRRRVVVSIEKDAFLPTRYALPASARPQGANKEGGPQTLKEQSINYYYENEERVYVLNEVVVTRRKLQKYHSFYDQQARHYMDSAAIAEAWSFDLVQTIQHILPGVTLEQDDVGEEYFAYFGKRLYLLANDFEENMNFLRVLHPGALLSVAMLDGRQGAIYFGEKAEGGVINISYKFDFVPQSPGRPNIVPFTLLGYQRPAEFYVPKYEIDSVRLSRNIDPRRTIYWNPAIRLHRESPQQTVTFYTADTPGRYSIVLEGITSDGRVCRERQHLTVSRPGVAEVETKRRSQVH
jgi:hypothetical protein